MSLIKVPKEAVRATLYALAEELKRHASSQEGSYPASMLLDGCYQAASEVAALGLPIIGEGRAKFGLYWTNHPSDPKYAQLWQGLECWDLSESEFDDLLYEHDWDLPLEGVNTTRKWGQALLPLTPLARWKYHPERMQGVLPFAAQVATIGRQCRGYPGAAERNKLIEVWQSPAKHSIYTRPLRARVNSPSFNSRARADLVDMMSMNAAFCGNGRQIFDIPASLSESFRNAAANDMALESVKLPYAGFYLHLGAQNHLAVEEEWTPEGAYVHAPKDSANGLLQVCIVSAPADLEHYREFDVNLEPVRCFSFHQDHMKLALDQATERVINEQMQAPDPMVNVCREMLKLVVNSLAYLTTHPADVQTVYAADAPTELLDELNNARNQTERQRIQTKLAAVGFRPVHVCGQQAASAT